MNNQLIVTSSPHIKDGMTTQKIMLNVIIALIPALIAAVVIFGFRALLVTAVCVVSCVFFEYTLQGSHEKRQYDQRSIRHRYRYALGL